MINFYCGTPIKNWPLPRENKTHYFLRSSINLPFALAWLCLAERLSAFQLQWHSLILQSPSRALPHLVSMGRKRENNERQNIKLKKQHCLGRLLHCDIAWFSFTNQECIVYAQ